MKHKFDIWKRKIGGTGVGYISHHIEMSESELEAAALQLFKERYTIYEDEEYEARIKETII